MSIADSYRRIRDEVPEDVTIVLAAKKRTPEEVLEALEAGATDFGENYVQEGEAVLSALGKTARRARWHMIGPLQKNKINKALPIFDVIQTVDSRKTAAAIDSRVEAAGKESVSVYIEVNIGDEDSKSGIRCQARSHHWGVALEGLCREVAALPHLRLDGLMTMAPFYGDPEACRPYFRRMREIFDALREKAIPGAPFRTLSMGMSDSYRVAIEEGSNMVRIGTAVFGPR